MFLEIEVAVTQVWYGSCGLLVFSQQSTASGLGLRALPALRNPRICTVDGSDRLSIIP